MLTSTANYSSLSSLYSSIVVYYQCDVLSFICCWTNCESISLRKVSCLYRTQSSLIYSESNKVTDLSCWVRLEYPTVLVSRFGEWRISPKSVNNLNFDSRENCFSLPCSTTFISVCTPVPSLNWSVSIIYVKRFVGILYKSTQKRESTEMPRSIQ